MEFVNSASPYIPVAYDVYVARSTAEWLFYRVVMDLWSPAPAKFLLRAFDDTPQLHGSDTQIIAMREVLRAMRSDKLGPMQTIGSTISIGIAGLIQLNLVHVIFSHMSPDNLTPLQLMVPTRDVEMFREAWTELFELKTSAPPACPSALFAKPVDAVTQEPPIDPDWSDRIARAKKIEFRATDKMQMKIAKRTIEKFGSALIVPAKLVHQWESSYLNKPGENALTLAVRPDAALARNNELAQLYARRVFTIIV